MSGHDVTVPAKLGSSCEAWDQGHAPECDGSAKSPTYCSSKWCFVDGCNCNSTEVPRISSYLPGATFQGNTLYYSYSACNDTDTWTTDNHGGACVNQLTEATCKSFLKCAWTGSECIGEELADPQTCEN